MNLPALTPYTVRPCSDRMSFVFTTILLYPVGIDLIASKTTGVFGYVSTRSGWDPTKPRNSLFPPLFGGMVDLADHFCLS